MIAAGAQLSGVSDWLSGVTQIGAGAILLYIGQIIIAWRKQTHAERSSTSSAGLEIKKHRDGLTIQMLEMARGELAAARAEVHALRSELEVRDRDLDRLRRVEWRLAAYEEAIGHIEALIAAEIDGGREAAEHAARVFLARMEALKLVMGEEAQAEQIARSKKIMEGDDT